MLCLFLLLQYQQGLINILRTRVPDSRVNKCSINIDFETNSVEVNRNCFDIATD